LSFKNSPAGWYPGADGWPSWWGVGNENYFQLGFQNIETDFMEWMTPGNNHQFNYGLIDWYNGGHLSKVDVGIPGNGANLRTNTDPSQPHQYGFLWMPATATSKGYAEMFFDRVQVGPTYTWDRYNGAALPVGPGGAGGSALFSALDAECLQLILGTGSANPMTVYNVQVWQASGANDIGTIDTNNKPVIDPPPRLRHLSPAPVPTAWC